MSKVYAFFIVVPLMAILIFKSALFFEFDTKQRYIKDLSESVAYKVKITGTLTTDEFEEFKNKLNHLGEFENENIVLQKGSYVNGDIGSWSTYVLNSRIRRGEAFKVYVKSKNVSLFSKLQNGGTSADDSRNLYYKAKGQCRVEKED